jgi:hypothetical protein
MENAFKPLDHVAELEKVGVAHEQALVHTKGLEAVAADCAHQKDLEQIQAQLQGLSTTSSRLETKLQDLTITVHAIKVGLEAFKEYVNARFDVLEKRFDAFEKRVDAQFAMMRWAFGLLFTLDIGILVKLFSM